jgi:hypothetical protein
MLHRNPADVPPHVASGRERLERLAAFVELLPPGRLNFASWRTCAVGLALRDPWFQAQGLCLEHDERVDACRPAYDGRSDWAAVARFFSIAVGDARQLLDPSGYGGEMRPDPKLVAAALRRHAEALAAA